MTIKGMWKLISKPKRFLRDYFNKTKSKKEQKEIIVNLIKLNVPFSIYYYILYSELNRQKAFYLAEKALNRAIESKPKAFYFYKFANLLQRKKQWWRAVESYEKAIELDEHILLKYYLEYVNALEKMERFEKIVQVLKTFADNKQLDADGYFKYGVALEKSGASSLAEEAFSEAIDKDEKYNSQELGLGIFYEKKGLWIPASKAYEKELKENSSNANLHYKFGLSLEQCYEWEKAEEAYLKAISLNCHESYWHYKLGFVRERRGAFEKASEAYKYAIDTSNKHMPYWYYRLGYVLTQLKQYEEASKAFLEQRIMQDAHGVIETPYNKDKALQKIINYTEYYESFEIERQTVLYESYHGASMSCNPYAIFLHLLNQNEFENFKHIWVMNEEKKIPNEFKKYRNVIFIKRNSDLYMRYLSKAKYLINNVTFPEYYIRKEGQIYLNTWHGTPIKSLGKDIKDDFMAHKNVTRNFLQASHLIQPNAHTTQILLERYDVKNLFSGIVAETGYPRQDLMINISEQEKQSLRKRLNIINVNDKIVLYAPTWRGEHGKAVFDVEQLKEDLGKLSQINGTTFLFRGHHMIENLINEYEIDAMIVPSDIDTNTLLSVVDVLITDYSSIAFDFLSMDKPIIYYTYDREEYEAERGFYFALEEISENICDNQEQLILTIKNKVKSLKIDRKQVKAKKRFSTYDDGNATQRVVDLVFKNRTEKINIIENNKKKNIVLYGGQFMANGISTSFINLVNSIDKNSYNVFIALDPNNVKNNDLQLVEFDKIDKRISIIPRVDRMLLSLEEKWIRDKFESQNVLASLRMYDIYNKSFEREYLRVFGENNVEALIHFEGYNKFWESIFAFAPIKCVKTKVIYQHNDMFGEWKMKYPKLEINFRLYNYYRNIVSVSKQTMEHNRNNLSKLFNINEDKFIYCDNIQNADYILSKSKEPIEIKEDESIFQNSKVFINIARLSPEKDQEKLIRAFKKVSQKHSDAKLLNLGSGPREVYLHNLIREFDLKEKIFFLGQRTNPFPYLEKADCFVMSSNHEGQPMTLFESLILKKPIIATDIVGNRSVLENRPGMLVENSEEGLVNGMLDFLEGRYTEDKIFDYVSYNNSAIEMFYEKAINENN